jgi:SAM-dependent methyltransferase
MSANPPPDDELYFAWIIQLLEPVYLAADNPRGQSGFGGDDERWERARRVIAEGVHRDGTFLDIGCANGLLMESLVPWAAARGYRVEPYGLDISERLAELARRRLPHWADRIYTGNAFDWQPPARFDFVRTELVYVPISLQREYVQRLLADLVAPNGRLLVCSYGSSRRPEPKVEPIGNVLTNWGFRVDGEAQAVELNGVPVARVAWITK